MGCFIDSPRGVAKTPCMIALFTSLLLPFIGCFSIGFSNADVHYFVVDAVELLFLHVHPRLPFGIDEVSVLA